MNKFKLNNKGISIISLIITIIVIIILAGIVLMQFYSNTDKANSAKILNEFTEVENAVGILGKMHSMDGEVYKYIGKPLTDDEPCVVNNKAYGEGYYYLEQADLMELGITGTTRNYVVNYFTGEVVVTEPFMVNQRTIYRKQDVIDEETGNTVTSLVEFDEVKGVNKPVLFGGMLPVKQSGGSWVVCSKDDVEWYDYVIGSNGPVRYANVMLLDDVTLEKDGSTLTNEQVRGAKLSDLEGYTVQTPGSMFVWVPRYTYKESSGGTEIVYSKLTNDYILNGYVKHPAFYNGEYQGATDENENAGYIAGGRELTGIWISKYQASYTN
ncbi:MAG: hypothetical protein IKI57_03410 [Clostridia bacterium]|nr:hypothetical protein [Clostridia bacterium]